MTRKSNIENKDLRGEKKMDIRAPIRGGEGRMRATSQIKSGTGVVGETNTVPTEKTTEKIRSMGYSEITHGKGKQEWVGDDSCVSYLGTKGEKKHRDHVKNDGENYMAQGPGATPSVVEERVHLR